MYLLDVSIRDLKYFCVLFVLFVFLFMLLASLRCYSLHLWWFYYCNDTSQESPFYLTVTSPALPSCCLPPLPLHHRSPLRQNFLLSAGWRMPPVPCWALHKCAPAATAVRHRNKTNTTLCIIEFSKIFPPGAISGQMCFSTKCRYFQKYLRLFCNHEKKNIFICFNLAQILTLAIWRWQDRILVFW